MDFQVSEEMAVRLNMIDEFMDREVIPLEGEMLHGDQATLANGVAEAQAKVTQVTQMFISTQKKYGRGTIAETFRLRGLPVKRFPRWETAPLPEEAIEGMRAVYREVGVLD